MGAFTIQLNHTASPQTVANFITLAEGTRPWIDSATGAVHTGEPYYNGVTFHRVIKDFMSQTGSRKGDGSDGPGYIFRDELANGLTHSGPYVVSMANSGTNTNGSQFFITDVATPHLDGKHTVFGLISSGQSVVDAINNAPTTSDKPNTPVVIQSIAIRRVGAVAQAFNPYAWNLPQVYGLTGKLACMPGVASDFTCVPPATAATSFTAFNAFRSTDLQTWTKSFKSYAGLDATPASTMTLDNAATPSAYYHLSAVSYPDPNAIGPSRLANRVLEIVNPQAGTIRLTFDAGGTGGTCYWSGNSTTGTIDSVTHDPGPFRGIIIVQTSNLIDLRIAADYDSQTPTLVSGRHTLHGWQVNPVTLQGTWVSYGNGTLTLTR
jgi:peptidyl-prolyl cis-trans isomerase A (cyclophilin A)